MAKNVDIIIINWNSGLDTLQAIQPYINCYSDKIQCNVIIVDNGSTDNSRQILSSLTENIIFNTSNLGFAKACNQAYLKSTGDFILLLNPDTVSNIAVLEKLVDFLESNKTYGAVGPSQLNENGQIAKTCGRFPTVTNSFYEVLGLSKLLPYIFKPNYIMQDWDHKTSKTVDHVMGSYMLINRAIVKSIGFMDEDYFVYMDDIDLSKRIHRAGFKIYYDATVSVYHKGMSTGEKQQGMRLFYFIRSRSIYWRKNFNKLSACILILFSVSIEPVLRLLQFLLVNDKISFREIITAYGNYYKSLTLPILNRLK